MPKFGRGGYRTSRDLKVFCFFYFSLMPSIFEYLGIVLYFFSNEHEPIHVHGRSGEFESKAEFYIVDGKITEIKIKESSGKLPLRGAKLKDFKKFLRIYADKIVDKWVDYFIYHKEVPFEKIEVRL